jgi:hypothetical protein
MFLGHCRQYVIVTVSLKQGLQDCSGKYFGQIIISVIINTCCGILQCRTVKITVTGDEGVPVQVDGEAWVQPPGFVYIVHKNRAQMLTRDKV